MKTKYPKIVLANIRRAVEIAEEIDNNYVTNFDEYCEIINWLDGRREIKDAQELIENWKEEDGINN